MRKSIGFVFFEEIHMIHHFIGIANELYKLDVFDIDILTYKGEHKYLYSLLDLLNLPHILVKQLPTKKHRQISEKIKGRKMPSSKYLFIKNKKLLLNYDVLIFSDINQEYLFDLRKNKSPKFVFTHHGAGDRGYPFVNKESTKFDLILAYGQSIIDNHKKYFDYPNTIFELVGYPKYDVAKIENKDTVLFNNDKPIILYNPHFNKDFSSWYTHGKQILNFFVDNKNYNLIFAPHIHLFNKKGFLKKEEFDKTYFNRENILIDLGSIRSVNMSYTLVADLYIGDVSSQVLEFLLKPRPCIFINRIDVNWQKNPLTPKFWALGNIIKDLSDLKEIIDNRNIWEKDFVNLQSKTLNYLIDLKENENSSIRGAKAIEKLLNNKH